MYGGKCDAHFIQARQSLQKIYEGSIIDVHNGREKENQILIVKHCLAYHDNVNSFCFMNK